MRFSYSIPAALFCCLLFAAHAGHAVDAPDYVEIRHAGDEDHPIFSLVLVTDGAAATVPRARKVTRYYLASRRFFDAVAGHVMSEAPRYQSALKEPPGRGTFQVTWKTSKGSGRYFVLPSESCAYLATLAKGTGNTARDDKGATNFLQDLGQNGRYVGCKGSW